MYRIKELNTAEVEEVYTKQATKDFDKTELKPLKNILRQIEKELYICYGMYVEDRLTAYAFIAKSEDANYMLLDYFAVKKEFRRKSYGSIFFELMSEIIENNIYLLAEVENPKYSTDNDDKKTKENRERFYIKNKFIKTEIESEVFKHKYTLFCLNISNKRVEKTKKIIDKYLQIYKEMLKEETYKNNIKIIN